MAEKEELVRFGVSMPAELIRQFDHYIAEQRYTNRSEAIRDLVRKVLLEPKRMAPEQLVAGTIVMMYDHHVSELPMQLMELQHDYHAHIISNMHVHLNHDQCLEIIAVRGVLAKLQELTERIQVHRGVLYCELSVTFVDGVPHPEHLHDGSHHHVHDDHHHEDHQHHSLNELPDPAQNSQR